MRYLILSICILLSVQLFAQDKFLFEKYGKQKVVSVKKGSEMRVYFKPFVLPNTTDTVRTSAYGPFYNLTNTHLVLTPDMELTAYYHSQDSITSHYTEYSYLSPKLYDISNIEYITVDRKFKTALHFTSFVSAGTLLILGPLVSYNMRSGVFNTDSYITISKPALALGLASLGVLYVLGEKKVKILH